MSTSQCSHKGQHLGSPEQSHTSQFSVGDLESFRTHAVDQQLQLDREPGCMAARPAKSGFRYGMLGVRL